jgi:hypothetical protein
MLCWFVTSITFLSVIATVDFTWLVPSSIYYIEENSNIPYDVAVEKAKWPQNRGTCVCQPTHFEFMDILCTLAAAGTYSTMPVVSRGQGTGNL